MREARLRSWSGHGRHRERRGLTLGAPSWAYHAVVSHYNELSNGHPGASIVTSTAACSSGGLLLRRLGASNSICHALRGLFIWLIMLPALPAGLVSSGCTSFAKLVVVATAVA